ncbi:MAG: nitrous oxide reductase family maturation protein NosD [bacterium]|nr:nitrous oxide reductase family maturation protein NosD [bacterium]
MLPLMCGAALVPHARADDGKDLPLFQDLIDATEENGILIPPPGVYRGPVMIDYPLTIEGGGQVTIDNGGEGSVIYVDSDGVTIKGLRLTGSGISYNDIDAGVQIRGNFNIVKDCVIDDCLFGIDLQMCEHCIIRRNTISSKIEMDLGQRGDGVRLWYSFHNKIEDNVCTDVRDMVVWYSSENEITGNSLSGSRYSLHFMYSKYNLVENNEYYQNAVGIFLMYSDGIIVRNNSIAHAVGPTGVGIGFKETSKLTIENNKILYCASGLYIDVSPYDPETTNQFTANLIAYNGIGVRFLNDWQGNHFRENHFVDNMTQVFVGGGGTANRNIWEGNHWSDYQGFDRDKDGVGDTPHEVFAYADRIWQDNHYAQFFKGSPLLETIDLLERLAPFSAPDLVVRDSIPRIREAAISPPVENSDLP